MTKEQSAEAIIRAFTDMQVQGRTTDIAELIVVAWALAQKFHRLIRDAEDRRSDEDQAATASRETRVLLEATRFTGSRGQAWVAPPAIEAAVTDFLRKEVSVEGALLFVLDLLGILDLYAETAGFRIGDLRRVQNPLEVGASVLIIPRPGFAPWKEIPNNQTFGPANWIKNIVVLPEQIDGGASSITVARLGSEAERFLPILRERSEGSAEVGPQPFLRIAVAPLGRDIGSSPKVSHARCRKDETFVSTFYLEDQNVPLSFDERLRAIIEKSAAADAHVLVLPELCVGPQILEMLRTILKEHHAASGRGRPAIVVAGSYHVRPAGPDSEHVNRSVMLDYAGADLEADPIWEGTSEFRHVQGLRPRWNHDKLRYYHIHREALRGASNYDEVIKSLGLDNPDVDAAVEPDRRGDELILILTSVGTIAVQICIDMMTEAHHLIPAVGRYPVDWLLIPSASTSDTQFRDNARRIAAAGGCSILVNACWLLDVSSTWRQAFCAYVHAPGDALCWSHNRQRDVVHLRDPAGRIPCPAECTREACVWVVDLAD